MESLSTLFVTEEKNMPSFSFNAGSIGTYATAITLDITKSGYNPVAATLSTIGHGGQYHPTVELKNNALNVALWRVSTGAVSQPEGDVKVLVLYKKS